MLLKTISAAAIRLLTGYIRNDQKPTQQHNSRKQTYLCMSSMGTPSILLQSFPVHARLWNPVSDHQLLSDSYLIRFFNSSRRYQCNLSYNDKLTPVVCVWCFDQYCDHLMPGIGLLRFTLCLCFRTSLSAKCTCTYYTCRRNTFAYG